MAIAFWPAEWHGLWDFERRILRLGIVPPMYGITVTLHDTEGEDFHDGGQFSNARYPEVEERN